MGRKKRMEHPWSSRKLAMAQCSKLLGHPAADECVEAFTAVAQEAGDYGPNSDEFIPWVADVLSAMERKHGVELSGGTATLLWVASGGPLLTSEDRFERSRKTWDEALRRARRRERFGGAAPHQWTARHVHSALVNLKRTYCAPRRKPTLQGTLAQIEVELRQLGYAAENLSLRQANALLRKIVQLRFGLYRRPRD